MMNSNPKQQNDSVYNILIASYLEPEYVERIRQVDSRFNVIYEPDLLRKPQYPADHKGKPENRLPEDEVRWQKLLAQTDILFDFDQTHLLDIPDLAPNVCWIQATSSGIGQYIKDWKYNSRMPETIITTAGGVHAQPLAEFCMMTMHMFNKGLIQMLQDQKRKHWERYAGTDLHGRSLVIIGIGRVGKEIARIAKAYGMIVIGVDRDDLDIEPEAHHLDKYIKRSQLNEALRQAEYLISIVPQTPETDKMLSVDEFALMPKGSIFINIGRGTTVDETALINALRSGHLGGAGLDVFFNEPLSEDSPLWEMDNVLISPHSASTSDRENSRITDIFCENLRRYLNNEPLINVLGKGMMF